MGRAGLGWSKRDRIPLFVCLHGRVLVFRSIYYRLLVVMNDEIMPLFNFHCATSAS